MANPYKIEFTKEAEADLKRLEVVVIRRIVAKLRWLADHADEIEHHPLSAQWSGFYKLRIGNYRVIYQLKSELRIIMIEAIGHRREVYKD